METPINPHRHDGTDPSSQSTPAARTAAASRARLKHGLYSRDVVIPGENQEEFETLRREMLADLLPQGREERELVEQMVRAQWRLLRLEAAETGLFASFDLLQPAAESARAVWLAQCFEADCGRDRALERLSVLQQRLLNQFLRCGRRLDALHQQHRRALVREAAAIQKLRPEFARGAVVEYAEPAPAPAPIAESPALVASDPVAPIPVTGADSATEGASASSGAGIGESADRGEAAAPVELSAPGAAAVPASEESVSPDQDAEPSTATPEDMARLEAEDERVRQVLKGAENEE